MRQKKPARPKPDPFPTFPLVTSIRKAGPIAAYLLARGFDLDDGGELVTQIQTFAGDDAPIDLVQDDEFSRIMRWIEQAYAVGIAVGQRLQPGAFTARGGVR